jgi:protein-L-isoaspartate(D-aspartate) O-methyltransferase
MLRSIGLILTFILPLASKAADDRSAERLKMVESQIATPADSRRPVKDPRVLAALREIPRHLFVPPAMRPLAYADSPLPIGSGQTISQPYIVGVMTEELALSPNAKVLEIGTGSGYQAAVLARLTPRVFSIEILKELAERASETLRSTGIETARIKHGDGYYGWPEEAPFDAIIVTCAAGHLPPPLWNQLAPGGRIIIPIGGAYDVQRLVLLEKTPDGQRRSRAVTEVRFVPMQRLSQSE